VQGERESHPPLLVAGDTYTCAVTDRFVECWGRSRDGFFSAPGPSRVAGLRLNGVASLSAGPRGLCGDVYGGGARCVGAIAAPPRGVSRVVVSQGDDASACGWTRTASSVGEKLTRRAVDRARRSESASTMHPTPRRRSSTIEGAGIVRAVSIALARARGRSRRAARARRTQCHGQPWRDAPRLSAAGS
jgi:hypothetical protein